eukprot:jgi/Tetstr1/432496/TSEL_021870.t1
MRRQWRDIGASDQVLRWIQEGVRIPFKHTRPPPNFHNGINMHDATPAQLTFRRVGVWHMPQVGIAEADRDYLTVDVRGKLYMLAGLPMGWSLSPYYFVTLTQVFITHLRKPEPESPSSSTQPTRSKPYLRQTRWRGARILPSVDDFLLFSASMEQALHLRQRLASLLGALGLQRNPTKGFWEPYQFGMHLGVDIDSASGMFYVPADKLNRLSRQATRLIGRATRNDRWLPVRESQSLAGQTQYPFLAIPAVRFFLRELRSVVGDRWGGRVRMTPQLRLDLQWWTSVPSQSKGKPIHRSVETAYLHTENSGYGWGGVLNGRLEARGFWSSADERQHITWKELKAVRLAVESFLHHLAGRNVLLHEDKHASRFGPHSIDRFASALNTMLPRYNAAWLDPTCEAVDSLHLPDADWRRENNWFNAPWPVLPDLVQKLRQSSGAAATVVAPRWEGKAWHHALTEMAVEELKVAPRPGFFRPGRRDGRGMIGMPHWPVIVFCVPFRHGSTCAEGP